MVTARVIIHGWGNGRAYNHPWLRTDQWITTSCGNIVGLSVKGITRAIFMFSLVDTGILIYLFVRDTCSWHVFLAPRKVFQIWLYFISWLMTVFIAWASACGCTWHIYQKDSVPNYVLFSSVSRCKEAITYFIVFLFHAWWLCSLLGPVFVAACGISVRKTVLLITFFVCL